ncbi:hypothetical protein S2M10_29680 [Sphingomonas sp. S2M10]|uniref:hypothetical protein n=1 Tax=Sphingomonas sp. S2M10 TaxID=2705010 RepID=UPI0014564BB0|nr:hypothetical protein [Sphingomonas sp. S2M10]NLS27966.1 hypothetical protein [Sphingomonas sp. S2M10]
MGENAKPTHKMGPSRVNHGNAQCVYCHATDLEIALALGPVCPNAPVTLSTHQEQSR